jgi:hypothetical protein
MAGAAHEFASALTPAEIELIIAQRHRSTTAVTKAPPAPPPSAVQPPAASQAAAFTPPWASPGETSATRAAQFPSHEEDLAMMQMLATPPEFVPMNIYDFFLTTAINALLIVSSSDRLSQRQKQEIRDIVAILRGLNFA